MLAGRPTIGFVAVSDLARAGRFYEETLGLELTADEGIALVVGTGEQMIRVVRVEEHTPLPYTVLGWTVPAADLAATVDGLAKRGVEFLRIDGFEQDDRGVWTAPGGDRVAWFTDPDGNVLSLTASAGR